jgi:hypothetical protein
MVSIHLSCYSSHGERSHISASCAPPPCKATPPKQRLLIWISSRRGDADPDIPVLKKVREAELTYCRPL